MDQNSLPGGKYVCGSSWVVKPLSCEPLPHNFRFSPLSWVGFKNPAMDSPNVKGTERWEVGEEKTWMLIGDAKVYQAMEAPQYCPRKGRGQQTDKSPYSTRACHAQPLCESMLFHWPVIYRDLLATKAQRQVPSSSLACGNAEVGV